jgi:hypothetical protein
VLGKHKCGKPTSFPYCLKCNKAHPN